MPDPQSSAPAPALPAWLPAPVTKLAAERPLAALCLRIAPVLLLFVVLLYGLRWAGRLSAEGYAQPWLIIGLLQHLGPWLIVAGTAALLALWRWGHLTTRWRDLEHGQAQRGYVVLLALIVAWPFVTLDYNYYFDQGYLLDRALIVLSLLLLWLRPLFILPFLLLLFTVMYQLKQPDLGGSILEHKLQVLRALALFASAFLMHAVTGNRRSEVFWFLTACLVAGTYWEAALAKLELNWLSFGHLENIPLSAWSHGWLGFLEPESIVAFSQWLAPLDPAIGVFVLVIEATCLLFLWNRRLSIALLVLVILFHAAVFVLFGFLFWTWILLDLALLVVLLRDLKTRSIAIYSRQHLLLSLLLIALVGLWARPPHLGWFDTRLSYTYKYQAIGDSGRQYTLSPRYFEPYADAFMFALFAYLVDEHKVLSGPYGVTKTRINADAIQAATSSKQIIAAEQQHGREAYHLQLEARFHEFLTRYLSHRNARGELLTGLTALQPPVQFWYQARPENPYRNQEPIRELIVSEVTTWYDGQRLNRFRTVELARLTIPDSPTATPP